MRDAAVPEPPPHKCSGKRNPGKGRLLERASPVLGNLVAARAVAAGTTGAAAAASAGVLALLFLPDEIPDNGNDNGK